METKDEFDFKGVRCANDAQNTAARAGVLEADREGANMMNTFSEIKLFQVKPDKLAEFEALIAAAAEAQHKQPGCIDIKYLKRFFTIDGVEHGDPPRELTKIVKCVKYFSYWEFDSKESYGKAIAWFFDCYWEAMAKLLIMPFDIHCGHTIGARDA